MEIKYLCKRWNQSVSGYPQNSDKWDSCTIRFKIELSVSECLLTPCHNQLTKNGFDHQCRHQRGWGHNPLPYWENLSFSPTIFGNCSNVPKISVSSVLWASYGLRNEMSKFSLYQSAYKNGLCNHMRETSKFRSSSRRKLNFTKHTYFNMLGSLRYTRSLYEKFKAGLCKKNGFWNVLIF